MLSYGNNKRQSNETSSAQFNKYIDRMNSLHPTQTPQYPGHMQPMSRKDALRAQMEQQMLMQMQMQSMSQQQMLQQQMLMQPNAQQMQQQMMASRKVPSGPPRGFIVGPGFKL